MCSIAFNYFSLSGTPHLLEVLSSSQRKDGLPNCLLFAWMVLILPDSRDAECSKSFWPSFPTRLLTAFSSSVKAPRSPPLPFLIFHIGISGFGRHLYGKEFRFLSPGTKNWTETHKEKEKRALIRERLAFEGGGRLRGGQRESSEAPMAKVVQR